MRPEVQSAARAALPRTEKLRDAYGEKYGEALADLVEFIRRTAG